MAIIVWVLFYKIEFFADRDVVIAAKFVISLVSGIIVYLFTLNAIAKEEAEMFLAWILRRR